MEMKSINCIALKKLLDKAQIEIIDVREPYETSCSNIGGHLIPMDHVKDEAVKLDKHKPYAILCQSGKRAEAVANFLEIEFDFSNLFIVEGGFDAYIKNVDNSIQTC
jgi:adenylyltransferase/sulfurtransferase